MLKAQLQRRRRARRTWEQPPQRPINKTVPDPVHGSSLDQATRPRGASHRHVTHHHGYRQRTPQAAHGHCVRAAPAMTWLPLNVAIIDNDRGDSPSSYRAHALRAGAPELPSGTPWMDACKVAAIGRDVLLSQSARGGMTRC